MAEKVIKCRQVAKAIGPLASMCGCWASVAFSGCALATFSDWGQSQCETTDDCRKRFAGRDDLVCIDTQKVCEVKDPKLPDWTCLTEEPKAAEGPSGIHRLLFLDDSRSLGVANAKVDLCGVVDVSCSNPIDSQLTDTQGYVTLNFPTNETFLNVVSSDFVPTRIYGVSRANIIPGTNNVSGIALIGRVAFTVILNGTGIVQEPRTGVIVGQAFDCDFSNDDRGNRINAVGGGVRFGLDGAGFQAVYTYSRGGLPSLNARETDSVNAYAIVANVSAGIVTVRSLVLEKNLPIRQDQVVQVIESWVTYVLVAPFNPQL